MNDLTDKPGRWGRLFIAADLHGGFEIEKLGPKSFPEGSSLCKNDLVVVAGDFGMPWSYPESAEDARWLDWLESRPWTTAFAEGNHEFFPALKKLPVEEVSGGKVHKLRPSVLHLMRGELFEISGMSVFAFGGARSIDRAYRKEGVNWWPDEMPTEQEMGHGLATLEKCGWAVDVVITHCAPTDFLRSLDPAFAADALTDYLDKIEQKLDYAHWYFGHYHIDKEIRWGRVSALYQRIVEVKL